MTPEQIEAATNEVKTFYRVNHRETGQGLWYAYDGTFTGLIHGEFSFCKNTGLAMDFDPAVVGFVSAVETLDQLYQWFTREDVLRLQRKGWFIHEYQSNDYKWYERFNHYVVRQESLKRAKQIILVPALADAVDALIAKGEAKDAELEKWRAFASQVKQAGRHTYLPKSRGGEQVYECDDFCPVCAADGLLKGETIR